MGPHNWVGAHEQNRPALKLRLMIMGLAHAGPPASTYWASGVGPILHRTATAERGSALPQLEPGAADWMEKEIWYFWEDTVYLEKCLFRIA